MSLSGNFLTDFKRKEEVLNSSPFFFVNGLVRTPSNRNITSDVTYIIIHYTYFANNFRTELLKFSFNIRYSNCLDQSNIQMCKADSLTWLFFFLTHFNPPMTWNCPIQSNYIVSILSIRPSFQRKYILFIHSFRIDSTIHASIKA